MTKEEFENKLLKSVLYNTIKRCYEIENGFTESFNFVMKHILKNYGFDRHDYNLIKKGEALSGVLKDPYYETDDKIGYCWFKHEINSSSNMCLYVEIDKNMVSKIY